MDKEALSRIEVLEALQAWLAQGAGSPLSREVYAATATRDGELFELLRARGLLVVSPSPVSPEVAPLRRTPFGVLPHSLLHALGLAEGLCEHVISHLTPRCSQCNCLATPPAAVEQLSLPHGGVIAVSVVDQDDAVSLHERCEWLGSERAVIGGRLIRVEDLTSDDGEPVLAIVPSEEYQRVHHEVSRWFGRGGGAVRLTHFTTREGSGKEVSLLVGRWSCSRCFRQFAEPARATLDEAPGCATCKGSGWLNDISTRLIACRDCDGFGVQTEIARYEFHGVPLSHIAALSFSEFMASATSLHLSVREQLQLVVAGGFGGYPIGAPVGLLSQGERALLSVVCGELSRFSGVNYLIDAALGCGEVGSSPTRPNSSRTSLLRPEVSGTVELKRRLPGGTGGVDVVLRDIRQGCLHVAEVRFPVGGLTALVGPSGSGKSLLLSLVAERFAKRRKLAHLGSFGELKRCSLVCAEVSSGQTVLEALGLAEEFAHEIARTRAAQELGITQQDLVLPRSRYRCPSCLAGTSPGEQCADCLGVLYDWRIAGLVVAGRTVGELLTTPLGHLGELPWASGVIAYMMRSYPGAIVSALTLSTQLSELTRPLQRFLAVWGGLARVASVADRSKGRAAKAVLALAGELVLVDGPRVMPLTERQLLEKMLIEINGMGATILYADVPESLEFSCDCVIHLAVREGSAQQRMGEQYLDARYARLSTIA